MTTNYRDAFILASPDTRAKQGTMPPRPDTIAGRQHALLVGAPYAMTSDELLFAVERERKDLPDTDAAREEFQATPRACLRASPLVRSYGWGIHHDAASRIAIYGIETPEYAAFAKDDGINVISGMRSSRGREPGPSE